MSVNPISMKDIDEKEQEFRINCQNDHESTNPREKLLIILAFIFLVLVLSLLSAIVISIAIENLLPKSEICKTKHCVMRAGNILENLNEEVEPCNDFYTYSCGGWMNKALMSLPDRSILSEIQFDILRIMYSNIKKINENSLPIERKVAKITNSCLNHHKTNKETLKASYTKMFKAFGGFPLINVKSEEASTGEKIANLYRLFGMQPILQIEVSPNYEDNRENILVITPPSKALFEDIEKDIGFTQSFLTEVFDSKTLEFGDVKNLNKKIKDTLNNPDNTEELFLSNDTTKYNDIFPNKFEKFINTLLGVQEEKEETPTEGPTVAATDVTTAAAATDVTSNAAVPNQPPNEGKETGGEEDTKLTVRRRRDTTPKNDETVIKILIKYPDTVKNILNVLQTETEETISNFLSVQFLKRIKNNIIYTSGKTIKKSRSKVFEDERVISCLLDISEYLNYAFGYMYISHVHIPVEEAKHVVESVRGAMKSFIPDYDWLDKETKEVVSNKLNEMQYFVGYPSWLDKNTVTDYYNDLKLDIDDNVEENSQRVRNLDKRSGGDQSQQGAGGGDQSQQGAGGGDQSQQGAGGGDQSQQGAGGGDQSQQGAGGGSTVSNGGSKSFIDLYMEVVEFNMKKNLNKLFETNDRSRWPDIPGLPITSVNAYYSIELNAIVLPAAILNPPIFDVNVPFYLNFGSLGTVIGHEITHGFDTNGRRRDKVGNVPSHETWSESSITNYTQRADCFREQYTNYSNTTDSIQVNGDTTLAENIADNGAIREALEGYRYWLEHHRNDKKEASLVALDHFTHEQLFFISYAQSWCHTASKTYLKEIENDEHTINQFRVIGTLSNSKDFSEAFSCTEGSYMSRSNKCKLW
ncbi:endothelin-converting enzyme homolog [Centruroides vittatus]|uniref:endothelin-converting enzyme homolog n=1 Tax=Centruroides vittatus TaxID=120091 RepID=UPI0035108786